MTHIRLIFDSYSNDLYSNINKKIILLFDLHAFSVDCVFTEFEGITLLKPENWSEEGFTFPATPEERCTDPNCFSHIVKYSATNNQVEV